ncbi:cytochrome c peroxidase [Stenotrophomonas sp.]|uniref:cytochrome-c peroxidase n=1 Tax=Stenotrophomonas sp. TaxID=69392 RepID=UPI0028982DE1|nr:cytochrome c peroxidase [Stenotrophomonas sp.]
MHLLRIALPALLLCGVAGSTPWADARPGRSADALAACQRLLGQGVEPDDACLRQLYAQPVAAWPAPQIDPGVRWKELGVLPPVQHPAYNPTSPAKVALGKRLFNEPALSRSGQIACASCHEADLGFADGRRVSFGHDRQTGRRNAPSVRMSAYATSLFWDGRAATLEDQALLPIADPKEMAFTADEATARLRSDAGYRARFQEVFGDAQVTPAQLAQAIASFQRSLAPQRDRFDRFLGGSRTLLDDTELRGLHLFRTKARCMNCHNGPALTDNAFHNLGLHFHGRAREDLGRYEITGNPADSGAFRTPSLRGVARTAPYMHIGSLKTLDAVLLFYNVGGGKPRARDDVTGTGPFPQPDPLVQSLGLNAEERQALKAFLEVL